MVLKHTINCSHFQSVDASTENEERRSLSSISDSKSSARNREKKVLLGSPVNFCQVQGPNRGFRRHSTLAASKLGKGVLGV